MTTLLNSGKPTKKSVFIFALTVVVSMAILLYFLPRESKFGFVYENGKPWRYSQLIASYDFPICKTDEEINRERDSVMSKFRPYYVCDTAKVKARLDQLRTDFNNGRLSGLPAAYIQRLMQHFHHVYHEVGVINAGTQQKLMTEGKGILRLIHGQQSEEKSVSDFYTERTAYEYIMEMAKNSVAPEVLRACNLNRYLTVSVVPDQKKNQLELESELSRILPNCGMVQSGQLIIDRGQIVRSDHVRILDSLKKESDRRMKPTRDYWLLFGGQFFYVLIIFSILVVYLKLFRRDYLASPHYFLLFFTLVTVFPLITYLMMDRHFYSVYIVPYAILPIFIRIFMDSRTSFLAIVASSLLSALVLHGPFEFILQQTIVGISVIYTLRELTERSQLLRTVFVAVATGLLVSVTYDLSQGLALEALDKTRCIHIVISGVLLLFAYPLMYLVEKVFGFTSSVTLVELTDINNSLLRRMSKEAQGTFNHSMQVANLAAEVADKIGAKPQLVRTGALYHDIGKIMNPAFFTENQSGVNPHDSLSEERSAEIIISHVTDGLRLAEKYHLPKVIRDFIVTHHGDGLVKYFYIQYCNKHPEEKVDKTLFSYPGPKPSTREQAILMMCDSVEAASRSLKEYTEESIKTLVDRIVDAQLQAGYFRECPITFRDIADAKRTLVDSLKTIYHTRISYPEMNRPAPAVPESPFKNIFGTSHHLGKK